MSFVVTTEKLTKKYSDCAVVQDLDLRVPEGCVYGFLGPNGSGKTTTMKMLLSLVHPSSGHVQILGSPMTRATRRELLGRIGSLIESPPGYSHLTGWENMRIVQRLLGLDDRQIDTAVQLVRMRKQMSKKVREFSLGMKQRLGIAMALARQPKLLILDEPTNGLDPAGIEEMRHLWKHLADNGVTVMVSSHLLDEIDKTVTMLGILSHGRMIFQGTRDQLFSAATPDVLIDCTDPHRAHDCLSKRYGSTLENRTVVRLPDADDVAVSRAVADVVGAGVGVYGVRREQQSLEDVFMNLTGGGYL
ncbi:MAG TPA: ATP-binding cassette domain-containing protein [Candidatus Stackebrandtia faecavium]|nr:ATP-binding cassette domain-containing protein [Candidatus Stackebrandtia faecavium]